MDEHTSNNKRRSAPPPTIHRNSRKPMILAGCGVILGALILLVVLNLDRQEKPDRPREDDADIVEIVEPGRLTEEERSGTSAVSGDLSRDPIGPVSGGRVQIADPDSGRLAQQYRFEKLDPTPEGTGPGWFHMTRPQLEVYVAKDRVLLLTGDEALAFAPNNAVESGTLTGNVTITLFEDVAGATLDPRRDEASLVLTTSEARFDNILGEVSCEGDIHLQTRTSEFTGRVLTLLVSDQDNVIKRLRVEEVASIRLSTTAEETEADVGGSDGPRRTAAGRPGPHAASAASGPDPPESETPGRPAASGEDAGDEQFYRLTLHDEIKIVQGEGDSARTARGDSLSILFTMESEGLGTMLALAPERARGAADAPSPAASHATGPPSWRQLVLAAAIGTAPSAGRTIAPPPKPSDTLVFCTGGLTMVPVAPPRDQLRSPKEAMLKLVGDPVELHDPTAETHASCGSLIYRAPADRLELHSSAVHQLSISSPEMEATVDRFWLTQSDGTGGFLGAGELLLFEAASAPADKEPVDRRQRVRATWRERVDLAFIDTGDKETAGLGRLRTATFIDGVVIRGRDLGGLNLNGNRSNASATGRGQLHCDELELTFAPDADRQSIDRVIATGNVIVADEDQTLWARSLNVRFAAASGNAPDDQPEVDRIIAERDVQIVLADGERVFADRLEVDGERRIAVLSGEDVRLVDRNNVIDRAERIVIDDRAHVYTLEGKGRYRRFDGPVVPATRDRLAVTMFDAVADRVEELRVRWFGGVEIRPVEGAPDDVDPGDLPRVATFRDNVQLVSEKLKLMHADEMQVGFAPDGDGEQSIRAIDATGGVHARAFSRDADTGASREVGAIRCAALHVDMIRGDDGRPVPDRIEASGAVHVANASTSSARQDLWTETLEVTFRHDGRSSDEAAADVEPETIDELGGGTYAHMITASGGVQVLLAGGERVFADRLVANAPEQSAEIFGERILIVGDEFVLDRCSHLQLDEQSGSYRIEGPGSFYAFAEPIQLTRESQPIERPTIDFAQPKQLDAAWTESALYERNDDQSGTLDLRGEVRAQSQPSEIEFNTISADILTLDFIDLGDSASTPDARQWELSLLLARGDAKLESRTWRTADHTDTPRVFYVAGQHVRYDTQTREARVVGDGHLLVRDEWVDEADAAQQDDRFAGKGTTDFRWENLLEMKPSGENVYEVVMTGNVECRHLSLDGEPTTMSGERLEATLHAQPPGLDAPADAAETDDQAGIVAIGGPVDLTRLAGEGNIFVRTTGHDVACDVFDYDTRSGIAEAAARPGRMVSVLSGEAARPLRAERVIWNMIEDTISVTRGSGAGTP